MPITAVAIEKFHASDQHATRKFVAGRITDPVICHHHRFVLGGISPEACVDENPAPDIRRPGAVLNLLDATHDRLGMRLPDALPLAELKRFRQWASPTPGHPEYGKTPGVEATTGPLGQGFGNAVGMAIAEAALAARFNRPDYPIVDHFTYVLLSDGDLMEGVASESASLAGHLQLGKLIAIYADNHVSLSGSTDLIFTENRAARFAAYDWHVHRVDDGNDVAKVTAPIEAARAETGRPSFLDVHTHIGYGSPHKHDTSAAHGEPLGEEEVRLTKEHLGWPVEPSFYVPPEAHEHFRAFEVRGAALQVQWESRFQAYAKEHPELAAQFQRVMQRELPDGWDRDLPTLRPTGGPVATRVASGKVISALASRLPELRRRR